MWRNRYSTPHEAESFLCRSKGGFAFYSHDRSSDTQQVLGEKTQRKDSKIYPRGYKTRAKQGQKLVVGQKYPLMDGDRFMPFGHTYMLRSNAYE